MSTENELWDLLSHGFDCWKKHLDSPSHTKTPASCICSTGKLWKAYARELHEEGYKTAVKEAAV